MIKIEDGRELAKVNSGLPSKQSKPITVGQLELALLARFPREDAEPWDRMGLVVGDPAALVKGVTVALDPTPAAIEAAAQEGANVLLTHHPAFIDAPTAFSPSYDVADFPGVAVYEAIANGVALVNVHTALDASVEATRLFPRLMNMDFERVLAPLSHNADKGYAMLCAVRESDSPFKLQHLAARVTSVFGRQPRVWGDFETPVKRVVMANGSANDFVDACLKARVDCLVCGELRYHTALAAAQAGLAIAEVGHDASEFPLCALLAQAAADAGVPQDSITVLDQASNWAFPDAVRI